MADTASLTPEQELKAAHVDLWAAKHTLAHVVSAIWRYAGWRPDEVHPDYVAAYFGNAEWAARNAAAAGDERAARIIGEYEAAATVYEGARVAVADLETAHGPIAPIPAD